MASPAAGTDPPSAHLEAFAGPYSLRSLFQDLDLTSDAVAGSVDVTCVEFWDNNLYIGTSAGEVQHYVHIPGDPTGSPDASFILASRQEPSPSDTLSGVKQILVLPNSSKACILSNGLVTFHTLPELSPAQGHRKLPNCVWIGARDLDTLGIADDVNEDVILVTMKSKLRLVKTISDQRPQLLKDIEFPGCLQAARRSRFACVADAQSYALLDVENQQKIPLFPISSSSRISSGMGRKQDLPGATTGHSRSTSTHNAPAGSDRQQGHLRATSLGNLVSSIGRRQDDGRPKSGGGRSTDGTLSPNTPPARDVSPSPSIETSNKPLPEPPSDGPPRTSTPSSPQDPLHPNIASPLPTEFLLTTGTGPSERGVGVFVNCDGDVVRGTLEFSRYPQSLVLDGGYPQPLSSVSQLENELEGYVLAAMINGNNSPAPGLEIQRWDSADQSKTWLALSPSNDSQSDSAAGFGVVETQTATDLRLTEVEEKLKLRRFLFNGSMNKNEDDRRNEQEDEFARRFSHTTSSIIAWHGRTLNWVVRNPLIIKLDAKLEQILVECQGTRLDQYKLVRLLASIRNREAKSEAEFLGLDYIRQKVSLILFSDLAINQDDVNPQIDEQLLLEGGADPRLILSMVPLLRKDIVEGDTGIWVHGGLCKLIESRLGATEILLDTDEVLERPEDFDIVGLLKRYLHAWRQKKGFGSIADETQVFQTVDAALLHLLLHQDQRSSRGPGTSSSLRAEIYSVVDQKIDCFNRAVELLEEYHRLYVLSRLYQSRKMTSKVLATWRRIIEGEQDNGGEFTEGEYQVPQYLAKIKDPSLFEEYGTWLANRNPVLAVQVFAEDSSKVKLPPTHVVELLREKAPDAVKMYLEHLVFGKKNTQYADQLISYYLDNVLSVLETSKAARDMLVQSYVAYRALESPRPTYRQFISDNATSASWWQDRLRLLELLGGSHGANFSYNVADVLARIEPFEDALIPESIILDGRQGRHHQALHLLTHGLGDYHTAINYCLLGGASIFHPAATPPSTEDQPSRVDQCALFEHLLSEFLQLEDPETSCECATQLLTRFGPWFQIENVLVQIPDRWPVETLCAFLTSAFRRIIDEHTQAAIVKGLSGVENLRTSTELIEKCKRLAPHLVPAMNTPDSMA